MVDTKNKSYVVILQCHIVKERCSGYFCEKSLNGRIGGFSGYPKDKQLRSIYMTCGGCCGRAAHRKISHLLREIKQKENMLKDKIIIQLASCITKNNYHGPKCPHLGYIKELLEKLGIDYKEDTFVCAVSEKRRREGRYKKNKAKQ